jgi:DNA modification methylase
MTSRRKAGNSLGERTIYEVLGRESVHPFPARMAPGIALEVMGRARKTMRVLDPMMGSGTVLAVGRSKGHRVVGFDLDPLAVLISTVWTTTIEPEEVRDKAAEVLDHASRIFSGLRLAQSYPKGADNETREFTRFWFDDYARRQLSALSHAIARVEEQAIRNVLWCGFSRMIITKQAGASLAMDLSHSRPHKIFTIAPIKPFRKFLKAISLVVANCLTRRTPNRGFAPQIRRGDACDMPLETSSIDLVLTSPPYLNAIDYIRCSKFSLIWMGYKISFLRKLRAGSIGTESAGTKQMIDPAVHEIIRELNLKPNLSDRGNAVLSRYINDISRAVAETSRVLKPQGKAVYVIGENTVRGTYIPNSEIVTALAGLSGMVLRGRTERALPANRRYLPPPSSEESDPMNLRMRREVILSFSKRAA